MLFASSVTLLFLGSFYGRMQIYTYESSFWRDLLANGGSLEMLSTFAKYIGILKSQWNVLTYIGLFQVLVLFLTIFFSRRKRSEAGSKE
jgi:LPXTG-motif cell wall-anchored protein